MESRVTAAASPSTLSHNYGIAQAARFLLLNYGIAQAARFLLLKSLVSK
jgi:hypothetical protein